MREHIQGEIDLASSNLGRNVKRLRMMQGLSQASLAQRMAFFSQAPSLRSIEAGEANPTMRVVVALAVALMKDSDRPTWYKVGVLLSKEVPGEVWAELARGE